MARAYRLRLRCFLEGIEIPIIAANMAIQLDAPVQCQVQIPATDRAFELLPRTLIHIFFDYGEMTSPPNVSLDNFTIEEPEPEQTTEITETPPITADSIEPTEDAAEVEGNPLAAGLVTSESSAEDLPLQENPFAAEQEAKDRKWKLFFVGEVTGYQLVKTPSNRSVVLQCLDPSNYWDTCYQYQVDVSRLSGSGTAHFVGGGTSIFDTFFQSATGTLIELVRQPSVARPELTGLMAGIVHLLEAVGGVYGSNGFRGVNDFFTLAELRLHLIDMVSAARDDTSSQRLFPRRAYNSWTRREGGRLGKIVSFRDMVNHLNKFIFHNTAPNPISMYEHPTEFERTVTRTTTSRRRMPLIDTTQGADFYNRAGNIRESLRRLTRGTGRVRRAGTSTQLTALANATGQRLKTDIRSWASENDISGVTMNLHRAGRAINELGQSLATFEQRGNQGRDGVDRAFATYEEFFSRTSSDAKRALADREINAVLSAINSGNGGERVATGTREEAETVKRSGRLHSQILRPDIFMVAPPRCNVIFPEFYTQFQTQKQWLRMVTRMRMTVSDEIFGPDELLNSTYFAPDVEVLGARARQGRQASFEGATLEQAAYSRRLMAHEHLTGPIPVFERMNEVNVVATRQEGVQVRGARVPYVTRAANHQFFKHRFSPHSANFSGPFNPFLVCGFPALIIDGHMTEEQVSISNMRGLELLHEAQERGWAGLVEDYEGSSPLDSGAIDAWLALRETVPTQHLGLLTTLNHAVAQQSITTTGTLTAIRSHRDREELLGANQVNVLRRDASVENVESTVAALSSDPPVVGMIGPKYGFISEVTRLETQSGRYHLYGTFRGTGPRRYDTEAAVGLTQQAQAYGPEVVTLVNDAQAEVTFNAYRIVEELDRRVEVPVDVPIEDFIRPPWMSDVWQNDRIGGVYQGLFGTGSITDPMEISTGYCDDRESGEEDAQDARFSESAQDPLTRDGRTVQGPGMEITVERAIDLLMRSYSAIKHADNDVAEFCRSYMWRPIADMIDIMGSRDLTIDANSGEVRTGREGFHSRAFGHGAMGENIANLIPPGSSTERIIGLDAEDRREEMLRIDTRRPKADRVLAYVREIESSRVLLG